ncbi:MAG: T9SS C-terminal target domain-containing protein, partial [Ignavibacteriae bacterium]|nr:T9SS C-terminal target domain-containing protein [Ignavibacteriota bacterium]
SKQMRAGFYEYEYDGSNNPSGVYFYKIKAGDYTDTKKMIYLK